MKTLFVFLIRIYQATFSLLWPLMGQSCRCIFVPSCSEYARLCLEKYSFRRAFGLSLRRLAKCHPFNLGGIDWPV